MQTGTLARPRAARLLCAVCVVAILSGCASGMSDANRTRAEGTAGGAAVGAAAGAIIGAIVGGGRGAAIGAGIGAAVGGAGGFIVGNEIAKRKQEYANLEDFYDAQIAQTEEFNRALAARNQNLRETIDIREAEIAQMKRDISAGRTTQAQLKVKATQIEREEQSARTALKAAQDELEVQQEVLADAQASGASRQQIAELEDNIQQLNVNIGALNQNVIALGQMRSNAL